MTVQVSDKRMHAWSYAQSMPNTSTPMFNPMHMHQIYIPVAHISPFMHASISGASLTQAHCTLLVVGEGGSGAEVMGIPVWHQAHAPSKFLNQQRKKRAQAALLESGLSVSADQELIAVNLLETPTAKPAAKVKAAPNQVGSVDTDTDPLSKVTHCRQCVCH